MRNFFEPALAPSWLKAVLASIRAALGDVWPVPLRLKDYATAELPAAASFGQGLTWNADDLTISWSDGTGWRQPQPADATLSALAALDATAGLLAQTGADSFARRILTGPAAGLSVSNGSGAAGNPTIALANDLAALEALSGTSTIYYRSGADTWSAVTIGGNLGFAGGTLGSALGTAATAATGTSGHAVPFLDGTNTWSGVNTFSARAAFGAGQNTTGTVSFRIETTGASGPPAGAAGQGIEFFQTGMQSFNRTSSAYGGFNIDASTINIRPSGSAVLTVSSSLVTSTKPILVPSFTVAGVPSAASAGQIIYVSNETGGAVLAFADGTNWRRVTDRAVVA